MSRFGIVPLSAAEPRYRSATTHAVVVLVWFATSAVPACSGGRADLTPPDHRVDVTGPCTAPERSENTLVINELVPSNSGVAIDEKGAASDIVELANVGEQPVPLSAYYLRVGSKVSALAAIQMEPGARMIFWADDKPTRGPNHLSLKLDADGDSVQLCNCTGVVDSITTAQVEPNDSYARFPDGTGEFQLCRYATPGRPNGTSCGPPEPPDLPDDFQFTPYNWDEVHPPVPVPLAITELGLNPPDFVELTNTSATTIDTTGYTIRLAPTAPGLPWPSAADGFLLPAAAPTRLAPGESAVLAVSSDAVEAIAASEQFEGVATLFAPDGSVADRTDFMRWPEGAVLARSEAYPGRFVFCSRSSPGTANGDCDILEARTVGDRVRHLRTLGDFDALAEGGNELGIASVEFVDDMGSGDVVHLLSSRDWSLHYEFIREVIDGQAPLDRCDPTERAVFNAGWLAFSQSEYFRETGRRYLLGTLVHHAAADLHTVEYALGDVIRPVDMRRAFFRVTENVLTPESYYLRPQDDDQAARALQIDGTLPIVPPNAPFANMTEQPLTKGIGYGVLSWIPSNELADAVLGPDVIVVTDDVPNDIPLVGGLITEAFQTPLAHVNVLCQNRGTPNLALLGAHTHPDVQPLLGQLVRFEVRGDGFSLTVASEQEAEEFWQSRVGNGSLLVPRLDAAPKEIVDLADASIDDLPSIGAKAAQLAELAEVVGTVAQVCPSSPGFETPIHAFAIPVSRFLDHLRSSGALALVTDLADDTEASVNPVERHARLQEIRNTILDYPVDATLLTDIEAAVRERFGSQTVRFRSSSNTEDLAGFNGAGLYTSLSARLDDPSASVAHALRTVWASLYSDRAYDERELSRVDQSQVAMGVLVHQAFLEERANGVAISRNVLDPTRGDVYYFNVQAGEASVTNPAPGVTSEQFIYQLPPRQPPILYQSHSSLVNGTAVLTDAEVANAACVLRAIVDHFRPLLDPTQENPFFAMDVELKLLGDERRLLLKQARPFSFGSAIDLGDCRNL